MISVIHTRTFEISLLGEKYILTEEEFKALQPECREIADFVVDLVEPEERTEKNSSWSGRYGEITTATDLPDEPEINSAPIDEAEMIKPMDVNAIKVRVEKMEPHRKGIDPYVKMHEEGKPMEAIKNQMLADNFCLQGSLSYHVKKVLAASNRVTKIELESAVETAEQTIERLKADNLANTEKRKKPRLAMK